MEGTKGKIKRFVIFSFETQTFLKKSDDEYYFKRAELKLTLEKNQVVTEEAC